MTTETEDGARKSLGNMVEREFLVDLVRDRVTGRRERANWTILERSPNRAGMSEGVCFGARAKRTRADGFVVRVGWNG